jgi:hypothetical protein
VARKKEREAFHERNASRHALVALSGFPCGAIQFVYSPKDSPRPPRPAGFLGTIVGFGITSAT